MLVLFLPAGTSHLVVTGPVWSVRQEFVCNQPLKCIVIIDQTPKMRKKRNHESPLLLITHSHIPFTTHYSPLFFFSLANPKFMHKPQTTTYDSATGHDG